jgi:catechol 2,3-dioxygenase-like lactoylglutathione lyase family enzyme
MSNSVYWAALVPELIVRDAEESVAFYKQLGFKVRFSRKAPKFFYLYLGRAQIMLEEQNPESWTAEPLDHPRGRGVNLQVEVRNAQLIFDRALKSGLPLFHDLIENWYEVDDGIEEGQLEFLIQDPDGYLIRFCQPLGPRSC